MTTALYMCMGGDGFPSTDFTPLLLLLPFSSSVFETGTRRKDRRKTGPGRKISKKKGFLIRETLISWQRNALSTFI